MNPSGDFFQKPVALFVWILLLSLPVPAQYVRKLNFPTERERRAQYALDDWISHSKAMQFTKIVAGTHYLYFATQDGGILRYQYIENFWDYPFTVSNGLPDNFVKDVAYDPGTGYLWAITRRDMAFFNPASEEWVRKSETPGWNYRFPGPPPEVAAPRDLDSVPRDHFFPREALLSLPTFFANGSYSILENWILLDEITFDEYPITGYFRDRYDRIWFTVEGFGIGQGDLFSQRADFYRVGLPDFSPRAMEYQGDDLWFGGIGRGRSGTTGIALWPYDSAEWVYFQARRISRLPRDDVNAILAEGDTMWFATEFGVSRYDAGKGQWQNFSTREGLTSNQVLDLAILGDDLYAATDQGITRIDRLTGRVQRVKDSRFTNLPFYRFARQGDTLWAGTFRGLFRLPRGGARWEFVPSTAAISDIRVTAVGAWGNEVWIASSGGIAVLDVDSGTWESFPQIAFEIRAPYRDITVNAAAVWVATEDGLLKFDKTSRNWRLFTTEDGLLDNRCYQLLLNGDFIWIVSEGGVTEFFWNSPQRSD